MKHISATDFKRLEQKVDLLHHKLDRLMAAQGTIGNKDAEPVQEEEKKRKTRERKHQLLEKEAFQQQVLQGMKDSATRMGLGRVLQHQFNLLQPPSAERIREYQRTKDPKAFDGLRRVGQGVKK